MQSSEYDVVPCRVVALSAGMDVPLPFHVPQSRQWGQLTLRSSVSALLPLLPPLPLLPSRLRFGRSVPFCLRSSPHTAHTPISGSAPSDPLTTHPTDTPTRTTLEGRSFPDLHLAFASPSLSSLLLTSAPPPSPPFSYKTTRPQYLNSLTLHCPLQPSPTLQPNIHPPPPLQKRLQPLPSQQAAAGPHQPSRLPVPYRASPSTPSPALRSSQPRPLQPLLSRLPTLARAHSSLDRMESLLSPPTRSLPTRSRLR